MNGWIISLPFIPVFRLYKLFTSFLTLTVSYALLMGWHMFCFCLLFFFISAKIFLLLLKTTTFQYSLREVCEILLKFYLQIFPDCFVPFISYCSTKRLLEVWCRPWCCFYTYIAFSFMNSLALGNKTAQLCLGTKSNWSGFKSSVFLTGILFAAL